MDNTNENPDLEQEQICEESEYAPRPVWQVWGARIALVIFLLMLALQLLRMAGGGL